MKANVSELFYSIQGEGITIGSPSIFIRFCGCNLRCPFCDTKYALDCKNYLSYEEIINQIKQFPAKRIIFTGGEPALQDEFIAFFISKNSNFFYQMETNGTILPKKSITLLDHITVSPKMFEINTDVLKEFKNIAKSIEFKFVVSEDFTREMELIYKLTLKPVVFQPVWENENLSKYIQKTKKIIEKVKEKAPFIKIIPQIHKILYGNRRGI